MAFSLHRLPASGCSPGWCSLQSQQGGEGVWIGGIWGLCRRTSRGQTGAQGLIQPCAMVTKATGDRGGGGPEGYAGLISITILSLGTTVVL